MGLSDHRLALLGGLWAFLAPVLLLMGAIGAPIGSRQLVVVVTIAVVGFVLGIAGIAGHKWAAPGLVGLTVLVGLSMGVVAVVMMIA